MNNRSYNVILLTGAPDSATLDWGEDRLLSDFLPCYGSSRDSNEARPSSKATTHEERLVVRSTALSTAWRFVPLTRHHLATGLTQPSALPTGGELNGKDCNLPGTEASLCTHSAFSTAVSGDENTPVQVGNMSFNSGGDETQSSFYEHSYAVHEDIKSSQVATELVPQDSATQTWTMLEGSVDLSDSSLTPSDASLPPQLRPPVPTFGRITDIRDIPNASYLRGIVPQTMTVNLIVGVVSIGSCRTIQTRKAGHSMDLVEILVGDETRAGFGITIWLVPERTAYVRQQIEVDVRAKLASLRPRDILLLRNVALSSFRGSV